MRNIGINPPWSRTEKTLLAAIALAAAVAGALLASMGVSA